MSKKTLLGQWKGGIRDSLVRIEMKPDESCCATWTVAGCRETGNMFGKLFNGGSKFRVSRRAGTLTLAIPLCAFLPAPST
jgi:hypothetical protein